VAGRAQTLRRRKHLAAGVVTPSATSTYLRDATYPPPRRITTRSSTAEIHSRGLRKLTRYSTNNRRRCRAREHPEEGGYRRPQRFTMMLPMPGCRLRWSRGFFAAQGMYAHPRGRACSPRCVRSDRFPARSHAASQPGAPACSVCTFPTSTRSKMPTATPPSRQPMPPLSRPPMDVLRRYRSGADVDTPTDHRAAADGETRPRRDEGHAKPPRRSVTAADRCATARESAPARELQRGQLGLLTGRG